jgi:hypothetical protein
MSFTALRVELPVLVCSMCGRHTSSTEGLMIVGREFACSTQLCSKLRLCITCFCLQGSF